MKFVPAALKSDVLQIGYARMEPGAIEKVPQVCAARHVGKRRHRESGVRATAFLAMQNSFAAYHQHIQPIVWMRQQFDFAAFE